MSDFVSRLHTNLNIQNIPHSSCAELDPNSTAADWPTGWHVVTRSDGIKVRIDYDASATGAQITQGDNIAMTMTPGAFVQRMLNSLYQDIQGLTAAQHTNIWNDLSAAVPGQAPRKYLLDTGPNAASIFVMDWVIYVLRPTAAQLTAAQTNLIAQYTQDNPWYLVNPSFDTSINIPGEGPTP
jgi:hypothetical protein